MRKIILIVTALMILSTVTMVLAAPEVIDKVQIMLMNKESESVSVETNPALFKLEKELERGKIIQNDIERYAYFLSYLNPTSDEKAYIDTLISQGYEIDALVSIFEFWKDTTEDIEIIKKVYDIKPKNLSAMYWVDEAFIELADKGITKNQYSNLTVEDVNEYHNKGTSYDEMLLADKLSRVGNAKFETIIEELESGKSWFNIINSIYSLGTFDDEKTMLYESIAPYDILDSITLSKIDDENIEIILDDIINGLSVGDKLYEAKEKKFQEIRSDFIHQGLWSVDIEQEINNERGGLTK